MYGLDLFSGIGGITKALEGYVRPVAYCDIEPYSRAVLLSRMATGDLPTAPIWDDVTTLRGDMLPHIDIIYGGFPCQDISVAGRGAGLEGERSGLFFEIIRLANEIRPEFVFLENVANIRSKGLDRVIKEMASNGYDCRYGILSASDVGAPHRRDRWWLLAHRNVRCGGPESREQQTQRAAIIDSGSEGDVADSDATGEHGLPWGKSEKHLGARAGGKPRAGDGWWAIEPNVGRVANGVPRRMDRLRALGNAVVPAQAREAFERLMGLKNERL